MAATAALLEAAVVVEMARRVEQVAVALSELSGAMESHSPITQTEPVPGQAFRLPKNENGPNPGGSEPFQNFFKAGSYLERTAAF
jgi:hypothetical protein